MASSDFPNSYNNFPRKLYKFFTLFKYATAQYGSFYIATSNIISASINFS